MKATNLINTTVFGKAMLGNVVNTMFWNVKPRKHYKYNGFGKRMLGKIINTIVFGRSWLGNLINTLFFCFAKARNLINTMVLTSEGSETL